MSGSEWRDIESAPKDGSVILLYVPGTWEGASYWPAYWDGGMWRGPYDKGTEHPLDEAIIDHAPTHWMSLRAPESSAMQSEGIPVYRHPDATDDVRPTCVTCGQSFDLQDPEQVAYHDQEGEHPPMK